MPAVIQIFKSVRIIEKPEYTAEARKVLGIWPDSIESDSGFVENGTLFLQKDLKSRSLDLAVLIILIDDIHPDQGFASAQKLRVAHHKQLNSPRPAEIFRLGDNGNGVFNLFLDYANNASTIGVPRRENHKFAELHPGNPIRYRINGKSDFTLSGRKQRSFYEFDYIFQNLGEVERIDFLENRPLRNKKNIPEKSARLVEERKLLR